MSLFRAEGQTYTDEPEMSPQKRMLQDARTEFSGFYGKFESMINGYFGTRDIQFTMKPGGWYIDLEKLVVNADPNFFIKKGYTESEALFASFHEAEHFRDMIRDNVQYTALFNRFKSCTDVHPGYPKALQRLYNCLDDILVNNCVMSRWKGGTQARDTLYPKLFPHVNLAVHPESGEPQPRFRQFMYALLREAMMPHEQCIVSDEVRAALNKVQRQGGSMALSQIITAVNESGEGVLSPEERFGVIQGLVEPVFEALFRKDAEDAQKEKEEKRNKKSGEKGDPEEFDDDPFEDGIPDPIDYEKTQEAAKKIADEIAKRNSDAMKKMLGVSSEDLAKYQKDYNAVKPQIESLSEVFDEVIERRKTIIRKLRRPTNEGVILSPARIATGVAEIRSGNTDPRVMLDYQTYEQIRTSPSTFEFTLVCDGSGSMKSDEKLRMQRRLAVLIVEALREFQERLDKERRRGENIPLSVNTEVRMFSENDTVVKPLGVSFTHVERVQMHKLLTDFPGGSNNEPATFDAMRREQFTADRVEKLQKGELKKVILFLTDGETDTAEVQRHIRQLERAAAPHGGQDTKALVIAGIGFEAGMQAVQTYAPNGFYAKNYEQIIEIFKTFLREILEDV